MKFLNSVIAKTSVFKKLVSLEKSGKLPLEVSGLSDIHKALMLSAFVSETKKQIILITPDEASASNLYDDLVSLGVKAGILPSRDYAIGGFQGYSKEYEHKRIYTLSKILEGSFDVVLLSVESAMQIVPPQRILKENCLRFKTADTLPTDSIISSLLTAGYVRSDLVEGVGQFSVRGGIIDIFAVNETSPFRIEFWGDEIDTISKFDLDTQRRTDTLNEIAIAPASEVLANKDSLTKLLSDYKLSQKKLTPKQIKRIDDDIEALNQEISFSYDRYISLIYGGNSIFDYMPQSLVVTSEFVSVREHIKNFTFQINEDIKSYLEEGFLSSGSAKIYLDETDLLAHIEKGMLFDSFMPSSVPFPLKELLACDFKRNSSWSGDIKVLKEDIGYSLSKGGLAVIAAKSAKSAQILNSDLQRLGINSLYLEKVKGLPVSGTVVTCGGLSSGFEIPELKFSFITHKYISSEMKPKKKTKAKNTYNSLEELRQGDYVVHSSHGIGIFDGINRITNGGITKDYIKIKYAKGDVLYVPVTQLDLVSKYIGSADEGKIRLNKLGTQEWTRTRSRVRSAVKNMAKELTELYAKRMAAKGYAFSEDTDLQNDFERHFEYEETKDQLRCISEIKNDMERAVPMDRLLCGDVGFGKTEVALRAAFKCISEGKQCAILVPTTILAWQHYNTILKRFGDLPVEVRMLSRFVSAKEQEKIVLGLKRGSVDLVVGTHRLISKDVSFKDLGLVVIDEEQRFGVAQKERLKDLYPWVDILTLSATPIPRTLNMAMSGLRDLSSIDEAPSDRYPVQSYVLEQNNGLLLDAIKKELRRGGQVYYLHNRVDTIERCALRLKEQLPDANIATAHGKMGEEELSKVWKRLMEHEIDVLVCTTIIETGVDVPNANTLIIEDADRFGLSQLHQLRGRVGRSPRRAYAYFCFRQGRGLSEVATKRLEAIREYTEFGSGFKIAMRDLEIRGAGSILGGEQHGNMEAVGYNMYLKLLNDAMNEEKGIKTEEEPECLVDLSISAHIPENYIESLPARLGIYRRIAEIKSNEDSEDVIDELCDRFGEPPAAVMGLINVALFRSKASKNGIYEITQTKDSLLLKVKEIKPELMTLLCDTLKERVTLHPTENPYYSVKFKSFQSPASALSEIAEIL